MRKARLVLLHRKQVLALTSRGHLLHPGVRTDVIVPRAFSRGQPGWLLLWLRLWRSTTSARSGRTWRWLSPANSYCPCGNWTGRASSAGDRRRLTAAWTRFDRLAADGPDTAGGTRLDRNRVGAAGRTDGVCTGADRFRRRLWFLRGRRWGCRRWFRRGGRRGRLRGRGAFICFFWI